mmetsp:Transcript_18815/g.43026  ORF Transcript_18815/g.43026 Transcript_18815/m.43026 type:complete len:117 (-) Transcript_18815:190-540(-)
MVAASGMAANVSNIWPSKAASVGAKRVKDSELAVLNEGSANSLNKPQRMVKSSSEQMYSASKRETRKQHATTKVVRFDSIRFGLVHLLGSHRFFSYRLFGNPSPRWWVFPPISRFC